MARQPLILALAAGLLMLLSSINILCRFHPDIRNRPWQTINHFFDVTGHHEVQDKQDYEYLIGVGKADITGPVAEINFMGYADPAQLGTGLRQRLYSRAFIVGNVNNPADRIVYLVLDTQSGDTAIRYGILEALARLGDEYQVYGQDNVAVTGTHSHSGPGAWLNYLLPQITSRGFDHASYQAIVNGTVASIVQAHEGLARGHLSVAEIEIDNANVNRSPYAYLANPSEERAKYAHDVDKQMTLLRFTHTSESGERDIGVLTWFAVHGTSMLGNNTLVTGDNKGVAARLFEEYAQDSSFVAGFSQANVGDTSPNVLGAFCESGEQSGLPCDFETSLCGNKTQPCHGRGPYFGRDDAGTASAYEIGRRQFDGVRRLFENRTLFTRLTGSTVRGLHQFADMSSFSFQLSNGTTVKTCPAALGYSFAAGTTDGPGAFDFKQGQPGDPHANPLWAWVRNRIHQPNDTQKACHGEKPILLDVGESKEPYEWSPNIVDIQIMRVGQLFIIVSPGEATTMAGRRWRESLQHHVTKNYDDFRADTDQPWVVLGGPANTYAHYISTREEYSVQRYEAASTLYGPHTLDAYINLTLAHLPYLEVDGDPDSRLSRGPSPPVLTNVSRSFITPVIVDREPFFKAFGETVQDVRSSYATGETISATFVGANPRNNFRLGGTFAAVERLNTVSNRWEQVRNDDDWSLIYEWKRTSTVLGTSEVTISWETKWESNLWRGESNDLSDDQSHTDLLVRDHDWSGLYRLKYYGDAKSLGGQMTAFEGTSASFSFDR